MIQFEIPLPPTECSPNDMTTHWARKGRERAAYKSDCTILARAAAKGISYAAVILEYEFFCAPVPGDRRYRPRDKDNALGACKYIQDSLVAAGIVKADDHTRVSVGLLSLYRTKKHHLGKSCVRVTVREA